MVNKLEGINRSTNTQKIKLMEDRSDKRKLTDKEHTKEKLFVEKDFNSSEMKNRLKEEIEDLNKITENVTENLSFELHEDTNKMMVRVIDTKTDEVIKELPPEEMLDLSARIHKMVGLLIDEKV